MNGIRPDQPLRIGQRLKLPNQSYLDAGRAARNNFISPAHYIDTTGRLPPNIVKAPPIRAKVIDSPTRQISKNGYRYDVDALNRTRRTSAEIRLDLKPERSRSAQIQAGKPDRRSSDDGGHFIAARFNGPRDWFNHFAQDANFNRGAYRALEDQWARAVKSGKRVFVDIRAHYRGTSKRPYHLQVIWIVDGEEHFQNFPNERQGR